MENFKFNIEEERERLREHLSWLSNEFSDDIPEKILHSTDDNNSYKVRKNWWQGVIGDIEAAKGDNFLSEKLKEKFDNFCEIYCGANFCNRLTAKEDINKANELIKEVLSELNK